MDDLDEELAQQAEAPLVAVIRPPEFIADMERLLPLAEALVSGFAAGRVFMDDPEQRRQLVVLRDRIDAVVTTLHSAEAVIERAFKDTLIAAGARQIPVPDHQPVRFEPARGEYVGDFVVLRTELATMAAQTGVPPLEEVHLALTEVRTVKPDHRRLNAMHDRYGDEVAAIIDRHRQFVTPPAVAGRVRFPTR